jgi:hypothetical protein
MSSSNRLAPVVSGLTVRFVRGIRGIDGRNLFLLLALVLACLRGWNLATIQMPFNGWDELPHIAAAFHVHKHGRMPSPEDTLDAELIPFIEAHPLPTRSASQLASIKTQYYKGDDPRSCAEPNRTAPFKQYQAQHGPLYYFLMASLLRHTDPASLLLWVDTARLLNIGFMLGFIALWNLLLRRLVPPGRLSWLPEGTTLLLVGFSYVSYNFIRFANDGLSLTLSSAALAWYVLRLRPMAATGRGQTFGWAFLGGITGLAVLAKATALPLVPVFGCLLAWRLLRARPRTGPLSCLLAFLALYLATAGPYHLSSFLKYGQFTGMQEAVVNAGRGVGLLDLLAALPTLDYGIFRNHFFYYNTAHIGGWSALTSPDWLNMSFKLGLECCLVGLAAALVRRHRRAMAWRFLANAPELPLLLAASFLALLYHALHSKLAWGVCSTNPWYAMVSQPVFFLLLCLGPALLDRRIAWLCLLILTFVFNAAYLDGTYNVLLTQETGNASLYDALKIAVTHHGIFRLDLHGVLIAEILCLFCLTTLCLDRVVLAWRQASRERSRDQAGLSGGHPWKILKRPARTPIASRPCPGQPGVTASLEPAAHHARRA